MVSEFSIHVQLTALLWIRDEAEHHSRRKAAYLVAARKQKEKKQGRDQGQRITFQNTPSNILLPTRSHLLMLPPHPIMHQIH